MSYTEDGLHVRDKNMMTFYIVDSINNRNNSEINNSLFRQKQFYEN